MQMQGSARAGSGSGLNRLELITWAAKLCGSALGWYVMSVGLTLFNKWILGCTPELLVADPEHGCDQYWVVSFKFPASRPLTPLNQQSLAKWCCNGLMHCPTHADGAPAW